MNPLITRLKALAMQPSTYRGLAAILGLVGIGITDGVAQSIGGAVIALLGLYDVLRDDPQ